MPNPEEQLIKQEVVYKIIGQLSFHFIKMERYSACYEIASYFIEEFVHISTTQQPFIDVLIEQFSSDTGKYEVKIALLSKLLNFMRKRQAIQLTEIVDSILDEPASNSIFKNNLNPIRVGLNLYKLIDDVSNEFNLKGFTTSQIKAKINEQLILVVDTYTNPNHIIPLVERLDLFGKDSLSYMVDYELFEIMRTKIFDKFIRDKWQGRMEIDFSLIQHSTAYNLIQNKYGLMSSPNMFKHLSKDALAMKGLDHSHNWKFQVWKHSMEIRFFFEFLFVAILTLFFQLYIQEFNILVHESRFKMHDLYIQTPADERGSPEFKEKD